MIVLLIYQLYTAAYDMNIDDTIVKVVHNCQRLVQYLLPVYWITRKDNVKTFVRHKVNVWIHNYLPVHISERIKAWLDRTDNNQVVMY